MNLCIQQVAGLEKSLSSITVTLTLIVSQLFVHGKGDKKRKVYINVRCDIWLKRYLNERIDKDLALFKIENASDLFLGPFSGITLNKKIGFLC